MEKMSIHRALAELKLLENKIDRAIGEGVFVKGYKKSVKVADGIKIEDFPAKIVSSYDKVIALLDRQTKVKSAITLSNAITKIEVGGEEMTVAEAIAKKASIEGEKRFLSQLRHQAASAFSLVESINSSLSNKADQYVSGLFSNKENIDTTKIETLRKIFIEENSMSIIDTIDIERKIEKLQASIEEFETTVDFKLSESNALTFIEI